MVVVIQRVSEASVSINRHIHASIGIGFLLLLGITHDDNNEDVEWLVGKISNLRVFNDHEGKMNLGPSDVKGAFLVISQFTLHASTKKGNRPSFIAAARPEQAIPLYELFVSKLTLQSKLDVKTGVFGADMKVQLINDGPVTIIIDSKNKV